jgi:AraC-like DNA-binding protein
MVEPADVPETLSNRNRDVVIREMGRFGVDPDELLRELAVRHAAATGPAEFFSAWNSLYVERLPPMSGLLAGATTPFGRWEVIDFLASCYPTVGQSFAQIARHFRLINPRVEFHVDDGAGEALPHVEFRHPAPERDEFFDEYTTGVFLARFRELSGAPLHLTALHSVRERPEDPAWRAEIAAYLGCTPTWGARHGRMVFSREAWATPLLGGDSRLRATLEAHATELYREWSAARGFGERVRAVIAQSLRDGEPRIGDVAQRLGMTARTLQRRLQDEALGFTALVDEARLRLARRYLADESLSISEVSFALGYSEPSAFTRAFKRWAGCAPAEFREAARGDHS